MSQWVATRDLMTSYDNQKNSQMFFKLFHYISGNNTSGENVLSFIETNEFQQLWKIQHFLKRHFFFLKNPYMFQNNHSFFLFKTDMIKIKRFSKRTTIHLVSSINYVYIYVYVRISSINYYVLWRNEDPDDSPCGGYLYPRGGRE